MSLVRTLEFKVGALVIVVGGLIGAMSMQVSDDPAFFSRKQHAYFLLPSAGGLIKGSAVKAAGIPVGVIKDISLQNGKARIDITVKSDLPLKTSATVALVSAGILGDKHVEVSAGEDTDPPLPENGQILNIKDQGSLDNVINKVSDIADSLKKVSDNLADAVSGNGTNKHILGRIMQNIEKLTGDLAQMTGDNKEKISEIVDQVHDITGTLDDLINDESDEGFKKTWKRTMARIDSTMKNVDEVASKINRGEGTIGKLVNDDTTVDELNTAIEGVSNLFDGASRIQTAFDFHGDYLGKVGETRTNIGINIQPGLDRFYYIGMVDDPEGVLKETNTVDTDNTTGNVTLDQNQKVTYKNRVKWTLLYGMNFWDLTVRGGIIEDRGGFGVDYNFFRRKLRLSMEAFDFEKTNLRLNVRYNMFWGLYVQAGVDDSLNNNKRQSGYLGAGLFLTNDDLKLLLTKAPF